MAFSTFAANALLNCYLRGVAITPPSRVWVSLHTADPGITGANEISAVDWPGYARQDPAGGGAVASGFDAASAKATSNAQAILFPEQDGTDPITITHLAIWDAVTGGNCLMTGALAAAKTINPTDEIAIRVGDLDCLVT